MLIINKNSDKLPMFDLWLTALKFCYDKPNIGYAQEESMRKSCAVWHNDIEDMKARRFELYGPDLDTRPVGMKGNVIDELEFQLGIICMHIAADDTSAEWLVKRRSTYLISGIDYLKAYGIKGSTKEELYQAMKYQKQAMLEHPEDYR